MNFGQPQIHFSGYTATAGYESIAKVPKARNVHERLHVIKADTLVTKGKKIAHCG